MTSENEKLRELLSHAAPLAWLYERVTPESVEKASRLEKDIEAALKDRMQVKGMDYETWVKERENGEWVREKYYRKLRFERDELCTERDKLRAERDRALNALRKLFGSKNGPEVADVLEAIDLAIETREEIDK